MGNYLLIWMGFVKHKDPTFAKLPIAEFGKWKEQPVFDIHAEFNMNDIPTSL